MHNIGCCLCQNSTFLRHCVFHGYLHTFHGHLQITVEYAWLFRKSMVINLQKHGYLQNKYTKQIGVFN